MSPSRSRLSDRASSRSSRNRRRFLVPVNSSTAASSARRSFCRASCACTFRMRSAISRRTASSSGVGRLGQEVIGAGTKALEPVFFSIARRQKDDVSVAFRRAGADAPAERRAVQERHHPVGDQERRLAALQDSPGLLAIGRDGGLVAQFFERASRGRRPRAPGPRRSRSSCFDLDNQEALPASFFTTSQALARSAAALAALCQSPCDSRRARARRRRGPASGRRSSG